MNRITDNKAVKIAYALLWVLASGVVIFEVPQFVFWSPVILFAAFIVFRLLNKDRLLMPVGGVLLLAFSFVFVFYTYTSESTLYYQIFIMLHTAFYFVMGYHFFISPASLEERFELLRKFVFAVSVLYILYVLTTYGYYLLHRDTAPGDREYWSVWYPGYVEKTATGFSPSMLFSVSWGAYALFFLRKPAYKILGGGLILFCTAFNIMTRTRLLVFLVPVVLFAVFFAWCVFYKKKVRTGIIVLSAVLIAGIAALLVYHFGRDLLLEKLGDTVFARYLELGFRSTRWDYLWNIVKNFSFTYTGGRYYSSTYGVPHNLWFYVYDYGGIVPFTVYCVFTVIAVVQFIRFLRNRRLPITLKTFACAVLLPILVEFMMEDLLYALPSYVILSHFFIGAFSGVSGYTPKPGETEQ